MPVNNIKAMTVNSTESMSNKDINKTKVIHRKEFPA